MTLYSKPSAGSVSISSFPSIGKKSTNAMSPVDKRISVLFVDHTARLSGGEIALTRLLSGIDRTKIRPIVLLAENGPLVDKLADIGIETHVAELSVNVRNVRKDTLNVAGIIRHVLRMGPLVRYCAVVGKFAKRNGIDIIHTNSLKSDFYGGIAGRLYGIPVVWHVRDHINDSYLPRPVVIAFRLLSNIIPSYVVANSTSTLELVNVKRKDRKMVVPSGIDLREDSASRAEIPNRESDGVESKRRQLKIGIVGRIAPWKGQHIFLQAAARIKALGYDAKFIIAGAPLFDETTYEQELVSMVDELDLKDSVEFLGFCSDVPAVMRSLDILVHASVSPEPFGQVVIEGMAEGLAVIGTDGGGVKEIITHKQNGLLVPMGDVDAMTEGIKSLIENPAVAQKYGIAAIEHIRSNYSVANSARRVELVYQTLMESRNPDRTATAN